VNSHSSITLESAGPVFITGTGTGVGKTLVAGAIIRASISQNLKIKYFKPIESGVENTEDSDAGILCTLTGQEYKETCPVRLTLPLAPYVASQIEGVSISMEELDNHFYSLREKSDTLLIEGAGGLTVPLCKNGREIITCASLAQRWNTPLIIVADAELGMLNHTVLTVEQAQREGLEILGILINNYPSELPAPNFEQLIHNPLDSDTVNQELVKIPSDDVSIAARSNPIVLSWLTQLPILAVIPKFPERYLLKNVDQASHSVRHLF
jgi:dethiobiotin synthetase